MSAIREYWEHGWSVFPLAYGRKKPIIKWEQFQTRKATEEEIDQWERVDREQIALVCGKISGVVVIDVDGQVGLDSLAGFDWPEGPIVQTRSPKHVPGGRWHWFFKHPGGTVANGIGVLPGVDIKGDGGYVVLPPSIHPVTKEPYMWPEGASWRDHDCPPLPPQVLAAPWFTWDEGGAAASARVKLSPTDLLPPEAAWDAREAAEGARNSTAASMAGHYYALGLGPVEVLNILRGWNAAHCHPPLPDRELVTVIQSIGRAEASRGRPARAAKVAEAAQGNGKPPEATDLATLTDMLGLPLESVIKYLGDFPKYLVKFAGSPAITMTSTDLASQSRFRTRIMEQTDKLPAKLPGRAWETALATILKLAQHADPGSESTLTGELEACLGMFFAKHRPIDLAEDEPMPEATAPKPFVVNSRLYFHLSHFSQFLLLNFSWRVQPRELSQYLTRLGLVPVNLYHARDQFRVWLVPARLVPPERKKGPQPKATVVPFNKAPF